MLLALILSWKTSKADVEHQFRKLNIDIENVVSLITFDKNGIFMIDKMPCYMTKETR